MLKQTKKTNEQAKKRVKKLITLYKKLCKSVKMVLKKWKCIITKKDLRDQTLKREIKCGYYTKTLKVNG